MTTTTISVVVDPTAPEDELRCTLTLRGRPHAVIGVLAHGMPSDVLTALQTALLDVATKAKSPEGER